MAEKLTNVMAQTQDPMKRGLVQKITNVSLFLRLFHFITVTTGFAYRYNRQETLGGIAFRGLNETYTADTGIVNPLIETLAIMGGSATTDRILIKQGGQAARANTIGSKVKKAGLFYDKYVIDGDPAVDPKQFYGLNARLTGNQVITAGANGAALTLSMVDDAIDRVVGTSGKVIVCNKVTRRKLTALVLASAGGAAVLDVGKQVTEYNGIPVELLDEDGDEAAILGEDETMGASAVTSSLYVIRLGQEDDGEYVQGLRGADGIEQVPYGERSGVVEDLVEGLLGLAVFHPRSACRVKGILPRS